MRGLIIFLFLTVGNIAHSQTFLEEFRKFQLEQIKTNKTLDSLRKTSQNSILKLTKKKIKKTKQQWVTQLNKQISQFDTVFKNYEKQAGYNFNSADSILIVYQTDIQSNLNKYIIISGNDTITYGERWRMLGLHSYERQIVYEPFLDTTKQKGFVLIDDKDSLMTLVSKRDFATAQKLAKENPCSDGATSTILFAKKVNGKYRFEHCFLQPYIFKPFARKE